QQSAVATRQVRWTDEFLSRLWDSHNLFAEVSGRFKICIRFQRTAISRFPARGLMIVTPSSPPQSGRLRRLRSPDEDSSALEHESLDLYSQHGNSVDKTKVDTLFGDGDSEDMEGFGDFALHRDDFGLVSENGAIPDQEQITPGAFPSSNLPPDPAFPSDPKTSEDPSPLEEAPWSTRATILFAQGVVLTCIVGTFIFLCARRHVKRSRRFAAQRAHARRELMEWVEAMQERTTIRISSSAFDDLNELVRVGNGNNAAAVRVEARDTDLEAVMNMIEGGLRSNSDNSLARLQHMQQLPQQPQQQQEPTQTQVQLQPHSQGSEDQNNLGNNTRSPTHYLLLVPRTILSVLTAPLRALDNAVNSWSTERGGYDAQYFQSVMDRIQREKDERMENPKEREVRLKEAFMKGRMVWELEDDCFVGPEFGLGKQGNENEELSVQPTVRDGVVVGEGIHNHGGVGDHMNESCDGLVGDEEQRNRCNAEIDDSNENAGVKPKNLPHENAISVIDEDTNSTYSAIDEPAINHWKAVSIEEESKQQDNFNKVERPETEMSKAMDVRNDIEIVDKLDKTEETNGEQSHCNVCPEVTETMTLNESAMPSHDSGDSNDFIYLAVPNRPRNRTVSEPSAQDIVGLAQSCDGLRLSQVAQEDDLFSAQPIRRPIPNQCAVCLCDYEPGDTIVVSASSPLRGNSGDGRPTNQQGNHCPHAFHQECIVEWLVKMQDGTPCPCCRQTFVELDDHIPDGANARSGRATVSRASTNNSTASETSTLQGSDDAERARQERRRRHIELGIQRGGRAFDISAISFGNRATEPLTLQELEEAARIRQERRRRHIELGIQRGGRAFDFSRISMR
ncbi:hypothetical protein ACHAXS_007508, partial [Conticribra weissflogii]